MPGTSNSGGRNRQSIQAHKQRGTYRPGRHGKNGTALNVPEGEPDAPRDADRPRPRYLERDDPALEGQRDAHRKRRARRPAVLSTRRVGGSTPGRARRAGELRVPEERGGRDGGRACLSSPRRPDHAGADSGTGYLTELGLTPASRDRVPQRLHVRDLEQAKRTRVLLRAALISNRLERVNVNPVRDLADLDGPTRPRVTRVTFRNAGPSETWLIWRGQHIDAATCGVNRQYGKTKSLFSRAGGAAR